jgi:hypothetical protein
MKIQSKEIILGGIYLIAISSVILSGVALMAPNILDNSYFGITLRSIAPFLGLLTLLAGIIWANKN